MEMSSLWAPTIYSEHVQFKITELVCKLIQLKQTSGNTDHSFTISRWDRNYQILIQNITILLSNRTHWWLQNLLTYLESCNSMNWNPFYRTDMTAAQLISVSLPALLKLFQRWSLSPAMSISVMKNKYEYLWKSRSVFLPFCYERASSICI